MVGFFFLDFDALTLTDILFPLFRRFPADHMVERPNPQVLAYRCRGHAGNDFICFLFGDGHLTRLLLALQKVGHIPNVIRGRPKFTRTELEEREEREREEAVTGAETFVSSPETMSPSPPLPLSVQTLSPPIERGNKPGHGANVASFSLQFCEYICNLAKCNIRFKWGEWPRLPCSIGSHIRLCR